MANTAVESPCLGICSLDEQDICSGCYRNVQEIIDWMSMDNAQREDVLRKCKERDPFSD
jgi:predicted Fe-S protein YdhL (DUF1289 family)